ncbi:MFS family permease [Nonomuraea rubra]|uniref:MFS family permease n=1 Tax=Nonomuraea rubra TaxID=46180 RepID=A0A7X0NNW1_9ACTN|nr:MFS family permease [Nonomuraea rubra]
MLSTRLPVIVLTLVGGAAGDRFSRRTIMLVADLLRFAAHGATAVLLITGTAQIWMLVVLQLVAGAGSAFFNPAAVGLIGSLAGREHLQAANSLISISRSAASIVALGVAGALVALVGAGWAVLIDALTFLVSAFYLYSLPRTITSDRPQPSGGSESGEGAQGSGGSGSGGRSQSGGGLLASIGGGLAEVRGRTWLWVWIVHVALGNMIVISPILVLGPYVADRQLGGAPAWSAIGIAYAVGGLAGGLLGARWRPARPMVAALVFFLLMAPLPALLAGPADLWLLVVAGAAAGLQVVVHNVLQTTVVQRHVPEEFVARATSVVLLGSLVAAPLGMALAGPAAAAFGSRPVLVVCAVFTVLLSVATLSVPSVWRIRADPRPAARTPAARTPAAGTPAAGTPVAGTPVAGTPVAGTPVAEGPEAGGSRPGTPVAEGAARAGTLGAEGVARSGGSAAEGDARPSKKAGGEGAVTSGGS